MEIYLIRHTTPNIEKDICYGQSDIDVTENFENEAKKIVTQIQFDDLTKVFSSPLKRCKKLAEKFSKNIQFDERLLEINFGNWELQSWNTIPRSESDPWMNDFVNVTIPNGESYLDLAARADLFFEEIKLLKCEKIIVVTHAGVIRTIMAKLNNIALVKSFDIKVEYGQVFKIEV